MIKLGVVSFNHRFGCQKCEVRGDCSMKRMSFPQLDCARRTDDSFRNRNQKEHHKETSLIEEIKIDMIRDFPTSDSLHLLDLGVMRKCFYRWVFGEKGYERKWSKRFVEKTSDILEECQSHMPTDIHRAIRNLDNLKRWKGLEYRTILLYVGMVVFKQILPEYEYQHFMLLCCAVNICSCKLYKSEISLATKLFRKYVELYIEIYGSDKITSNVHNLVHISEDMNNLKINNLAEISTYKYENCLRLIGLKVKHCNLPLEQVVKRITEMSRIQKDQLKFSNGHLGTVNNFSPKLYYGRQRDNDLMYDKIEIKPDVTLSNRKRGDSWFLAKSDNAKIHIVKMKYAFKDDDQFKICGWSLDERTEFFNFPVTSTKLHIYASNGKTCNELDVFNIESVIAKMICLPCKEIFVYIPLLHTLESLN